MAITEHVESYQDTGLTAIFSSILNCTSVIQPNKLGHSVNLDDNEDTTLIRTFVYDPRLSEFKKTPPNLIR